MPERRTNPRRQCCLPPVQRRRLAESADNKRAAGDGGDQSFWRRYFDRVHELPVAYNAEKTKAQARRRRAAQTAPCVYDAYARRVPISAPS